MSAVTRPSPEPMYDDWDDDDQNIDETQLVTFKLGSDEYGLPIMHVQEILRMSTIARLPSAPPYVEGVMKLRGDVLLVIDLRKRLNLRPSEHSAKSRIVVVTHEGRTLGLVVDSISSVLRLANSSIKPAHEIAAILRSTHVMGIAAIEKRLIVVLQTENLLSDEDLPPLDLSALQAPHA